MYQFNNFEACQQYVIMLHIHSLGENQGTQVLIPDFPIYIIPMPSYFPL